MATDAIAEQLASIKAQLDEIQRDLALRNRRAAELEELKDDLSGILRDMMGATIVELNDVAPFLQSGDLTQLVKKLLRNTHRISQTVGKLEGISDFVADAEPLVHDLFHRFILKLDELERKGYFRCAAQIQATLDVLVQTLVQQEFLAGVQHAMEQVLRADPDELARFSLWKLYRTTRSPEMRRLLGTGMAFLTALAAELDGDGTSATGAAEATPSLTHSADPHRAGH